MAANELEKSRKELAGEYERVQKKAFTNWVNSHLLKAGQKVDDLYQDFRDGQKLLLLLELLTEVKLPREKGKMLFHKLQNVGTALDFLQKERKIKLVNIRSEEIVDGNPKLILGLVWTLILHFQISGALDLEERPTSPRVISTKDLKEKLLDWARKATEGYEDVSLANFDKSWRDGMGFCAIINRHRPDLLDFDDCDVDTPLENLERAFTVAENELGVIRIVDPEDVCVPKPDDKAVLTYVSFLHHAFPEMPPPHWKKKPKVSLEDYQSLYDDTKKWIDEKTKQTKSRDFPNTVDEMESHIAEFDKTVTKEMPAKKRDMSTLSGLSGKLKEQKKTIISPEYEYPRLEEAWTDLQKESTDCKDAMDSELKRLQDLQSLADQILSDCDTAENGLDQLEDNIKDFEQNSTTMAPGDAASLSDQIKSDLKSLESSLNGQLPKLQQLKDGNYHDTDKVQQRLGSLQSRLASLAPRLDDASSAVGEAQVVAALESNLDDLEVWLVTSGKFSNNQQILVQIEDHKAFQYDQLSAAEERIAQINSTPPPTGLEEKVKEVNQRFELIAKQTKDRLAGLEPIVQTVMDYEVISNPLEEWCTQTRESYNQLPPLEVTEEQLVKQKDEINVIKDDVGTREDTVEKVQELAEQFMRDTEPVQSLADRYARKLKSRERVAMSATSRDSEELEEASISEQAEAVQIQWDWLKIHADARSRQIDDLLDKIRQFNDYYNALRQFVEEGTELLDSEKPVGDTAGRLEEQMETCQDFRAKISAKQPSVDAMLALGRAVLAEPNTTSQNDALMHKLTGFISDWSDLQLAWQNWYDELHANMEQSQDLSNQFDKFQSDIGGLEPLCSNLFPANLSMEDLKQKLHNLQTKFRNDVLSPYEERRLTYQDLKSKVQLLPDKQSVEDSFKTFEEIAQTIEGHREELSAVVVDVDMWWGDLDTSSEWLTETENTLTEEKPLASSVDILERQEKNIKSMSEAVATHKDDIEKVLKSLGGLASHERLLQPTPVVSHKEQMKNRWDSLCNEVQERSELCTSGKDQLTSYAGDSVPFNIWLKVAEDSQKDFHSLPRNKEELKMKQTVVKEFLEDVRAHADTLDQVESIGSKFLSSAKAYQSQLVSYRQTIDTDDDGGKLPEFFVKDEDLTELSPTSTSFDGDDYENGIRVVTGFSGSLRKRYDALHGSANEYKQLVDEAVARREGFDVSLGEFMESLGEIEKKCAETESQPMRVQERVEIVRSLEVDCLALDPHLQTVASNYDLLADLGEGKDGASLWEGDDEPLQGKEEAEKRHKELLDRLKGQRENLSAELSDAQAFLGSFEDFLSWLRETERKIQRDDPLKLEVNDLKSGLTHLKGVASDITAHRGAYDALCNKCQDLIDRGVQDSDELKQNLDNAQQRWNAIQIVNDDIEVIDETIPKLESFDGSYSQLSSNADDLFDRINSFSVSAISSQGLEVKGQGLQEFSKEVDKMRTDFDALLNSCDMFDTPFDATKFEADIRALQDKLNHCEKVIGSKKSDLKTLEKKVRPMEDLFNKFRTWLAETETQLTSLSPPSLEETTRTKQRQQAKIIVENVEAHRDDLEAVEDSVNIVYPLVDEPEQQELKKQLDVVSGQYDSLKFDSELYPVERWLEDRSLQLADMAPTGVVVPSLQDQLTEVQEFQKAVECFKSQLDSLSSMATQADQTSQRDSSAASKMAEVKLSYDKLNTLARERLDMLSLYLPDIQRYESSKNAWESLLCGWEKKSAALPSPGATPESIQSQIEEIKLLQLAITDHEPEFVSLKREVNTLCQGPPSEPTFFEHISQETGNSSGKDLPRPGKDIQEETISDYDRRLEALKRKLTSDSTELVSKLDKSNEFKNDIAGLLAWLEGCEGNLDDLVIREPKSVPIEQQHTKCQGMMEGLSTHQATKDSLQPLFAQLTSELPDTNDERTSLQKQLDELEHKWTDLSDQLKQHQSNLDTALPLAKSHEGAMGRLLPWVPATLERLENMGPPPAEPDRVEQLKSEVESLKAEYNTLAPVYSTCVEDGQSMSTKCEEGEPRTQHDEGINDLQEKWEKLNKLFGDILHKLTDALVQTQEFQAIANGLDRWMDGMGNTLRQQERIAARVRLIEPQVDGFRHILSDITAYSSTVDQAKTLGTSLIDDSKPEESQRVKGRLEAIRTQFSKLEAAAQTRMTRLEGALKCATVYEDEGSEFNKWLVKAEEELASMEEFAIASQPLKQQLEKAKSFIQDVESHTCDTDKITKSEEDLFDTELPTIQLCEEHLAKTAATEGKLVLPDWLERPGAPEAVEVGADLRDRFDKLKISVGERCDEADQLLQSVLAYESNFDKFSEWLSGEKMTVSSFTPPAITVDVLKTQLEEVENTQCDFNNQEDPLEALNAQGTTLIDSCKAQLSQSSARIKLSDLNESWGDALSGLSTREEKLKEGLTLAEAYQGLHDNFDDWLTGCENKLDQPLKTEGDPKALKKHLEELKVLSEDVSQHKSELKGVVDAGHKLERYTDAEPSSLPDIGYTALEDRYNAIKVKLGEHISKIEQVISQASDMSSQLQDLLKQLEKLKAHLAGHKPPRVQPPHIEKQIKDLTVTETTFVELQPQVEAVKQEGAAFASLDTTGTPPPEGVPSGADIQQLLTDIDRANGKVDGLVSYWKDVLTTSLQTAKKFEDDKKSLSDWIKEKDAEIASADTVRGIPEGVEEQQQQVEALQVELTQRKPDLDGLATIGHSLTEKSSPEDKVAVEDKLAQVNSAFDGLQRSVDVRKRVVDDGLARALAFLAAWNDAMDAIAEKSAELGQLGPVGGDIDTVKSQLEEYKEFESSLSELKPKVTAALTQGKQLKDNCSSQDEPYLSEQLEKLNTAWSQLNSDSLSRKHKLEDALLQLGQFHEALAELLTWIVNCMGKIMEAPLPGVKVESVEAQIRDLKAIEAGISSHAPSVASLNSVGEKLVSSTTAENTADIQQDLDDLNNKWKELNKLVAARNSTLNDALPKSKSFKKNWKKELNWLTGVESHAYSDWKPCGLPDTCQADLNKHQMFTNEVDSHQQPIDKLKTEGEGLKTQGSPEDQKVVDRWIGDILKRYDDLKFTMDEREAQMQYAKERADEFDQSFCDLRDKVAKQEETQDTQGPIRSEVEVVKQQMEDHKDFMRVLGELEGQLDDLDGWGQLLVKDCVKPDGEIIQDRVEELRSRLDDLNSAASDRQSSLEESLLSLGEFEEAYDELWTWLADALKQLEDCEPITGDPDLVAAQLARHKALQKQLGARLSSKNAVSRAGKLLMKHKAGEDKAVLKKKLQDLEREWEKACQISVDRQDKLENAYRDIAEFRSYLGPLRSWTAKVLPSLDESEPVHGDLHTVDSLLAAHEAVQRDLGTYQENADLANSCGEHLIAEVLDDPTVTQQDLQELNESWDNVCQRSVAKQERLEDAYRAAQAFEDDFGELVTWIDTQSAELQSLPPPDEDSSVLQQQIDEHKELSQEVTARQPNFDKVLGDGQNLLQVAHPRAVPILQNKLQQLERKWVDLRGRIGARSEALASALLELHGLQDMLDNLWSWVGDAETTIRETEMVPVGNDLETVEQQLAEHESFQEEMATQQPNMDALNKAAKKRKANHPHANPEMTKKIGSLYKRWQKLWLRSSERHRQLLEAKTRLNDIALARSFNFDKWRKRFNTWVDQQKLRVSDLFHRFDGNHDGMLTREEFMKALKASGLAITQIELEKIADSFDKDRSGMIDLSAILGVLKGSTRRRTRPLLQETMTDSDKIETEIQHQVSKCTCTKQFLVTRVAEGQYRFGDNQKLRLVRILRSTVMVRVGGGWEPLEEFLQKHDPCRASGRTNAQLRGLLTTKKTPGLATAGFTSKHGTQMASKNEASKRAAMADPSSKLSTRTFAHGRKDVTVTTKKPVGTVHTTREQRSPHRTTTATSSGRSTPLSRPTSGRSTPLGKSDAPQIRKASAARLQSPQPRSSTPSSRPPRSGTPSSLKTSPRHALGSKSNSTSPKASPKHTASVPSTPPSGIPKPRGSRIPTPKSKIPTKTT